MTTLRPRLTGLGASIVLAFLLVALPALLIATRPARLPSLDSPDDGTLALLAIWGVSCIVWVILAGLIIAEIAAAIRGIRPPQLGLLDRPRHLIRDLVATAALLFVATSTLAAMPTPVAVAQPTPVQPDHTDDQAKAVATEPATIDYVVEPGDSLWRIAERHLGDGNRYPEIVDLNPRLLKRGPDFLRQGWTIKLPAVENVNGYESYTVRKGDTLSEIALEELGDARAWPKIADASRHIIQPDGRRLTDPDQIDIGWTFHIPTPVATDPTAAHPPSVEESEPEPTPRPAPTPTSTPTQSAPSPAPTPTAVTPTATSTAATAAPAEPPEAPAAGADDEDVEVLPAWMLLGVTGGGVLLAGGLWKLLTHLRDRQFRHRRPGRRPTTPEGQLVTVERSIHLAATAGAADLVQHLDTALKYLASMLTFNERPMPRLAAVHLTGEGMTVHLTEPVDELVEPWMGEGTEWTLLTDHLARLERSDQAAPWPLLVTVGADDDHGIWLINAEQSGTLSISGDPTFAEDLARFITAEIGVQPWAEDTRIDCIGIAAEMRPLNPVRIHHHAWDAQLGVSVIEALEDAARLDQTKAIDTPTARATDADGDTWKGHLVLVAPQFAEPAEPLRAVITDRPGRTGTAIVLLGASLDDDSRLHLDVSGDGRLAIPELGLDLVAVGITTDEASGFAQLAEQASTLADAPIGVNTDAVGWESLADQTGSIRAEHTLPRDTPDDPGNPATSVLPKPDEAYLDTAATTADDLDRIAPKVSSETAKAVADADRTLDADLADWNDPDCVRPKLRLLGPISVELHDGGMPQVISTSQGSYVELLAFLATRTRGATTQQVADALRIDASRVRSKVSNLRDWLGRDPETQEPYVPLMHQSTATKASGVRSYELRGVLVDAELFRRLHLRGKTRGADGLDDLKAALALVTGEPLTGFSDKRGNWVYDGDRLDQQYIVAVADVAHIVATAALQTGDKLGARAAALVALTASPAEEVARRDYQRAGGNLGDHSEAPASPLPDDEDWPPRTRQIAARAISGARAKRGAG